jgi:general secretion pathway protein L
VSDENVNVSTRSNLDEAVDSVKGFWQWWTDELAGLMPKRLRSQFKVQSKALLVEIDNGICRLKTKTSRGAELLSEFSLDAEPDTNEVNQRNSLAGMSDQTILLLPEHYILRKAVSLPLATINKLEDVLKFEMDRNTPFKANDVYFIYRIISRDTEQQKVHIELAIVTRAVLDELLERLASQGIKPTTVVSEHVSLDEIDNPACDLLPLKPGSDQRMISRRKQQLKLWILVILILLIAGSSLYQRYQLAEQLSQDIEAPKELAMQAKKLRSELEQLKQSRQYLTTRKAAAPSVLIILNELTILLPDNTWLTRLSIKDGEVTLKGESTNASVLISLIEQSELFLDVRFTSPVTINPRTQKEHFSLTARLESGGAE